MAEPDKDAPTQRILSVIEVISAQGPITLVGLCAALPISRAAIWRALDTLRAMGWVRMRAGDSAYELRHEVIARLHSGHTSLPEVDLIAPIFDQLAAIGPVHVDLGGFTAKGVFRVVESTRKTRDAAQDVPLSLVDAPLAIAAQLTLAPDTLLIHLRAHMIDARDEDRRALTSGEHGRNIADLRDIGHLWAADRCSVALSLPAFPGFAAWVELRRHTRRDMADFISKIEAFIAQQRAAHPNLNPILRGYSVGGNRV
jgi:hypothetical protein